jgi:cyclase
MEGIGADQIIVNSIDRDGIMAGYDLELIRSVALAVHIPVVALGGVGKLEDFLCAVSEGDVSAIAAGSLFVFHGKHRAALISYPGQNSLSYLFREN